MKRVLFIRREGVYLPEISAYLGYVRKNCTDVEAYDSSELQGGFQEKDFDVVWKFMGFDRAQRRDNYIVHEYGSLSVSPFPTLKDFIKRSVNAVPDRRVFLNEIVQKAMGFKDNVPLRLRDMGIGEKFFSPADFSPDKKYDFVYSGSLNRGKVIHTLFEKFKNGMDGASLLVIGAVPDEINASYGNLGNIHFTGRVKYDEVPKLIAKARYGLNIMPDIYPFNIQTSTKVLEYCASCLPIVTTDYEWARKFEGVSGGRFFYLKPDFSNLSLSALQRHDFVVPDVSEYTWDEVIRKSGVFDFLKA